MKKRSDKTALSCSYLASVCLILSQSSPLAAQTANLAFSPSTNQLLVQRPNCSNPQTQVEMNICAGESLQKADRELNRVYQLVTPKLPRAKRQKLVNAQTAWIKFRDTECQFSASFAEGGTMQPMLQAGCLEEITEQRTAELNSYFQGKSLPARGSNYRQVDARLNQVYQQLRKNLETGRRRRLETAETAWIKFRDSACDFERTDGGNTAFNTCLIRMTEQRTKQLENHLELTSL